jgi:hypothetical protein
MRKLCDFLKTCTSQCLANKILPPARKRTLEFCCGISITLASASRRAAYPSRSHSFRTNSGL